MCARFAHFHSDLLGKHHQTIFSVETDTMIVLMLAGLSYAEVGKSVLADCSEFMKHCKASCNSRALLCSNATAMKRSTQAYVRVLSLK